MNETAAKDTLLLRAFENSIDDPRWSDEDRIWVNRTTLEYPGITPAVEASAFVAQRAQLGVARLVERDAEVANIRASVTWRAWIGPLVVLVAFLFGMATDAIGPEKRVNLLAPPLLGIIAWNLVVYLFIAGAAVMRSLGSASTGAGWMSRLVTALASGWGKQRKRANELSPNAPGAIFTRDWLAASAPLNAARASSILHFAAAALAAGALTAMYLRGLGLEYVAGWESTFLDSGAAHSLLSIMLSPASWITGIEIPDAQVLATMRFPTSVGVDAAPWIHLIAVTLTLIVILPRVLLGLFNAAKATQLRDRFGINTDSPYFESLARVLRGDTAGVLVVPYSYRAGNAISQALNRLLGRVHGADAEITTMPALALGDEDDFELPNQSNPAAVTVALFAMTATPEHENHGEFIKVIREKLPNATRLLAVVDESGFRKRFGQQGGRLEQRSAAWRKIIGQAGLNPIFVDLSAQAPESVERQLQSAINKREAPAV
jgi:hypothetical protein